MSAYFADPYVVLVKDDSSILVLQADKTGELEPMDLPEQLRSKQFLSATFYHDQHDFFQTSRFSIGSSPAPQQLILAVLTTDGLLTLYPLPRLDIQIFQYHGLDFLPLELSTDMPIPKHWRNRDTLAELVLADLGDEDDQQPYLIVRTRADDLAIYQPYAVPGITGSFRFKKAVAKGAVAPDKAEPEGQHLPRQAMQAWPNIGGFAAIVVPGSRPSLIMKSARSMPRVYNFRLRKARWFSVYHDKSCAHGLLFVDDDGQIQIAQLPQDTIYGISDWLVNKVELNDDISNVTYFEPSESYVLAMNHKKAFILPQDDEWHQEWQGEQTNFLPTNTQSSLKLFSAKSHSIISQHTFDESERVLCLKTINLEVSEETHERKDLIVVGTAIVKGENVTTRGNIYVFDVVDVVPQPGVPETDLKLKLVTKEDVRGAVSAVDAVGSQGFMLVAQGQKCMVRGLKEDNSILPVAFMDMRYYTKIAKELKGTGLCILGDAFSGMWLMGYSEEPYKMQLLGRDFQDPPVFAAEFLPDGKQLYILTSDDQGELRVLQYDPENPKTERGTKLLLRSTFKTGTFPTKMTLLPRAPTSLELAEGVPGDDVDMNSVYARHQVLVTTQEGAIALITPLSDYQYRRLSTLQNIMITNLEHACGLNPRAHRQVETDGLGGRGMVDGNLIKRWMDQSSQHKSSTADKAGGAVWDIAADLEAVGGAGLAYL